MTESRNQFEEWFFSEVDGGTGAESLCWQAWQASRAAVVVKLPEYNFGDHHRNILIDEVQTELDAAGIIYE